MSTKTKSRSKVKTIVRKPVIASEAKKVKTVITETKVTETTPVNSEVKFDLPVIENKPGLENTAVETPAETIPSQEPIKTLSSSSMLDDLQAETDKDNEPANEFDEFDDEPTETSDSSEPASNSSIGNEDKPGIGEKIHETLTSESSDWQNPGDWKKMCAVNAMMYVEGGAIFLSFLGQLISGDWTPEGEKKYMPSEERRKLIRNPLAAKLSLNKQRKQSSPTGAMWTAIIFTILPIIIIAFKDRKAKIKSKQDELEMAALKSELEKSKSIIAGLQINAQPAMNHTSTPLSTSNIQTNNSQVSKSANSYLDSRIEKRGRHKKDCDCDKCNLRRMSTKGKKVKA